MLEGFNLKKILTVGDAMVTFNPSQTGPLRFVSEFKRTVGGAELNFAVAISRLGMQAKWISRLGDDEFGKVIYTFARGEGIDVSNVEMTAMYPTSIYFKEIQENGGGKSFYYRQPSPLLALQPEHITADLVKDVDAIHLTGVYLAVCAHNIKVALKLLALAKEYEIPVSFDPNLRLKLWSIEEAKAAYEQIYPYVDILLTGKDEFELLFGSATILQMEKVTANYGFSQLVVKDGEHGAAVYNGQWFEQPAFPVKVVDTVGAGDAFDAAYMYGYLQHQTIPECLRLGNAAGALTTTVKGDNEGLPELKALYQFVNKEKIIER